MKYTTAEYDENTPIFFLALAALCASSASSRESRASSSAARSSDVREGASRAPHLLFTPAHQAFRRQSGAADAAGALHRCVLNTTAAWSCAPPHERHPTVEVCTAREGTTVRRACPHPLTRSLIPTPQMAYRGALASHATHVSRGLYTTGTRRDAPPCPSSSDCPSGRLSTTDFRCSEPRPSPGNDTSSPPRCSAVLSYRDSGEEALHRPERS